ncbi:8158_t:CDS:2, partial [Racocetra persica]
NRQSWRWDERICLSEQAKMDMRWLLDNLETYNGRPAWRPSLIKSLYVDASTTSWCAKLDGQTAFGNWPEVLSFREISKLEAEALLLGLRSFTNLLEGFWAENTGGKKKPTETCGKFVWKRNLDIRDEVDFFGAKPGRFLDPGLRLLRLA